MPSSLEIWIEWRMAELHGVTPVPGDTLRIQAKNELQRTPGTWMALMDFHRAADNARLMERHIRTKATT